MAAQNANDLFFIGLFQPSVGYIFDQLAMENRFNTGHLYRAQGAHSV